MTDAYVMVNCDLGAEEAIIASIANGLTTIIRDNPEFLFNLNKLAQSEEWNDKNVSSGSA